MSLPRTSFIVLVLFLAALGVFAARVYSFYHKIDSGTLTAAEIPDVSYASRLSTSQLAQASASNVGGIDVVTTDDPSMGSKDAPLTIVEFADFGCPYSEQVSHVLRRLATLYPETIHYIYRDFPLADLHPEAVLAAVAGECAEEQKSFWAYHDKLYQHQDALSEEDLIRYAEEVGMDKRDFRTCLNSGRYTDEVVEDISDGSAAGVYGTPTFFLNGTRVEGAIPDDVLTQIVTAFL